MNREGLLKELSTFGFIITAKYSEGLFVNGINIGAQDYKYFGYRCGGEYNPLGESEKTEFNYEDIKEAIIACREIYDKELKSWKLGINYHDIKDFLNSRDISKVENQASERVLKLIQDNYQELYRGKLANLKE